ncbi:hypothetical protein BaRGS_00016371 [Batillaria attramentaria]|uniref:Uncharacterized protein n=1 Tax=Batillaria attramentaria TaxID=370345 RepID=A0ABD0KZY4_9CAEN
MFESDRVIQWTNRKPETEPKRLTLAGFPKSVLLAWHTIRISPDCPRSHDHSGQWRSVLTAVCVCLSAVSVSVRACLSVSRPLRRGGGAHRQLTPGMCYDCMFLRLICDYDADPTPPYGPYARPPHLAQAVTAVSPWLQPGVTEPGCQRQPEKLNKLEYTG